jgi:ATP-dependent DNA ligase
MDGAKCPCAGSNLRLARAAVDAYLGRIFEFCLPTTGAKVPDCPDWIHEIEYDGYRVERNGDRVLLITRGGYD